MTKEMMRLLLLQVAGLAGLFGAFSPRIKAAVSFLVAVCQPEIFDLLWNADHTSGGVNNPVGNTPAVTEQAQGGPKPGKGGT
jgi:hypothetical protein